MKLYSYTKDKVQRVIVLMNLTLHRESHAIIVTFE